MDTSAALIICYREIHKHDYQMCALMITIARVSWKKMKHVLQVWSHGPALLINAAIIASGKSMLKKKVSPCNFTVGEIC